MSWFIHSCFLLSARHTTRDGLATYFSKKRLVSVEKNPVKKKSNTADYGITSNGTATTAPMHFTSTVLASVSRSSRHNKRSLVCSKFFCLHNSCQHRMKIILRNYGFCWPQKHTNFAFNFFSCRFCCAFASFENVYGTTIDATELKINEHQLDHFVSFSQPKLFFFFTDFLFISLLKFQLSLGSNTLLKLSQFESRNRKSCQTWWLTRASVKPMSSCRRVNFPNSYR